MAPNENIEKLLSAREIDEITCNLGLLSSWCDSTIFLFSDSRAILISDLTQEYEIDVQIYDRLGRVVTFNLYGVAADIIDSGQREVFDDLILKYFESIDFDELHLRTDRKKRSLCFSLAVLRLYGARIFSDSFLLDFSKYFSLVIDQVSEKWERCMNKK